jgi:hypothetical protein
VSAAKICKFVTERVGIGLPMSIVWGNNLAQLLNMAPNDLSGMIGGKWKQYSLRRQNLLGCHCSEILSTQLLRHPVLKSAFQPVLVVTMLAVAERFKSVIDKMKYGSD